MLQAASLQLPGGGRETKTHSPQNSLHTPERQWPCTSATALQFHLGSYHPKMGTTGPFLCHLGLGASFPQPFPFPLGQGRTSNSGLQPKLPPNLCHITARVSWVSIPYFYQQVSCTARE